ncbi:MAG: hypothetical protein Q7Q71_15145 [Verrucomicrobiota bacterium JB023]|nr:hypothetical protein [Verrucomicrobiota bacterium JB023]
MKTARILSSLFFFGLAFPISAQEAGQDQAVSLKLNYVPGNSYVTETVMTQEMTMAMGGQEIESNVSMTMVKTATASAVDEGVKVSESTDRMIMKVDTGGMQLDFDSENPEGPMAGVLAPMLESKTHIVYDADGGIVSVEVPEIPGGAAMGMDQESLEIAAKEMAEMMPGKPVKPGEKWISKSQLPLGQLTEEPVAIKYEMVFVGMKEIDGRQLAQISIDGSIQGGDENLKLTSKSISGEMYFDSAVGQVRTMTMDVDMEIGLPEGVPVQEGGAGVIPMKSHIETTLKEIK